MSKTCLYIAVVACFLSASANAATNIDFKSMFARASQAAAVGNMEQALELYCALAWQGYGPAQYEVGVIYEDQPGTLDDNDDDDDDEGGRRDIAAAMMWLDMALLNGVVEAKAIRRKLGRVAGSEDFDLYGRFTRMETEAPCVWEDIYLPSGRSSGRLSGGMIEAEEGTEKDAEEKGNKAHE